jgi:hypothetical protein
LYLTAETLPWANPLTAFCCLGVVTVMTLKPDCASKDSFWGAAWLVPVVWHAAISASAAMAPAIFVSINSFFICFVSIVLFFLGKIAVVLEMIHREENSRGRFGSPSRETAEQFREARLVRITHGGAAIGVNPVGMLGPQVVVKLLPELGVDVD